MVVLDTMIMPLSSTVYFFAARWLSLPLVLHSFTQSRNCGWAGFSEHSVVYLDTK